MMSHLSTINNQKSSADLKSVIKDMLRTFDKNTVHAALIRHWAYTNQVSIDIFDDNSATNYFLNEADVKEVSNAESFISTYLQDLSLKDLENSFELIMSQAQKTSQGVAYTPDFIADYLIDKSIQHFSRSETRVPIVCDPSCGSGGFMIRAAILLKKRYKLSLRKAFEDHLVGIDIDHNSLKHARCLIELFLAFNGEESNKLKTKLIKADTLISGSQDLLRMCASSNGFDIVSTNPPYVKLQNLEQEYRALLIKKYDGFAKGSFSLAPLFLIACHRLLSPNGCVSFITQNNIFTSLAGEPIRQYLQDNKCLWRIIDFSHQLIFANMSSYTCLMFLSKKRVAEIEFESISIDVTAAKLHEANFSLIPYTNLDSKKWRLAKPKHLDNLSKIESVGLPLGTVTAIRVGFATLKDQVFFCTLENKTCLARTPDGQAHKIEHELTRGALKISEWANESMLIANNRRIIFPYKKINGSYRLMPENILAKEYPLGYKYLIKSKLLLADRDKGKVNPGSWYAWGRSQSMDAPGPKLVTKTFSSKPLFMLDLSDQLFCNGYALFPAKNDLFSETASMDMLKMFLNSKVMHYYARLTSFQIDGGYQCYQKNFIEKFGIPKITPEECNRLKKLPQHRLDQKVAELYGIDISDIAEVVF